MVHPELWLVAFQTGNILYLDRENCSRKKKRSIFIVCFMFFIYTETASDTCLVFVDTVLVK